MCWVLIMACPLLLYFVALPRFNEQSSGVYSMSLLGFLLCEKKP